MVLSDLDDVDVNDGAEIMSYSGLDTNFWLVGDCAAERERDKSRTCDSYRLVTGLYKEIKYSGIKHEIRISLAKGVARNDIFSLKWR